MVLSSRQLLILQVIIDEFIKTAQPIGSRAISKKEGISLSPATIRNEMADLEELGYLEKTHSSSGRVPSEKGYRFYVDHMLSPFHMSKEEHALISTVFDQEYVDFEQVVQKSGEVLSDLTNYTSIILGPEVFEAKLKQLQIIKLTKTSAVAILVTNKGHVEHRSFTIPAEIKASDLEKLVNILNEKFHNVPIIELHNKIEAELSSILKSYIDNVSLALKYLRGALFSQQPDNYYMSGMANMLLQPEFNDVEKIHSIYSIIEREDLMIKLLRAKEQGIKISIGQENKIDEMQDLSLIKATYSLSGEQLGTIALLGPKRMDYSRVVSLISLLSQHMSKTFTDW
ncbi:MAG: heat-inducible transcriptional repressor HrcA [Amphibacillus sp.]|nr:heat-inducible transcriptional repressor HrcA [Amphibacillus sp.]